MDKPRPSSPNPRGIVRRAHAPAHYCDLAGHYIITAGTYHKEHIFSTKSLLHTLVQILTTKAELFGWTIEAYSVFSNHYHLVVSSEKSESLPDLVKQAHGASARGANRAAGTPGRRVWYQCWDTYLDDEKSHYARLKYVLENPVRHGLVSRPEDYPWGNARQFLHFHEDRPFVNTVLSFKTDQVSVEDDFAPVMPSE